MSDTETFEREAAVTRERISSTIDDLHARLSPKALVDSAVDSLNASGAHALASVRGAAMGHPYVIAAAGAAVGIALLARRTVRGATIEYGDSYAAYADYDDGYADNLAAGDTSSASVGIRLEALQHQAHVAVEGHPIAVIAAGIVAGVVIGSLVPVSATEQHAVGEIGLRLEAAGDAAIASLKGELDVSKMSLTGGMGGISDRAVASLMTVLGAAGAALLRKPARA